MTFLFGTLLVLCYVILLFGVYALNKFGQMGAIMKVSELIALLQKHPPDMPVAYHKWSEQTMMEPAQIKVMELCQVRIDGWIQEPAPRYAHVLLPCFPRQLICHHQRNQHHD